MKYFYAMFRYVVSDPFIFLAAIILIYTVAEALATVIKAFRGV